jgi:deferrochelatase/peroxidase EfeB
VKAALAIGGTGALSACIQREGAPAVPTGPDDPGATYSQRQFAWNDYLVRGGHGDTQLPNHQLILLFDYVGEGAPTDAERASVDAAFDSLERAYQRGNGGVNPYQPGGQDAQGLLFTVGYSRQYFDRFEADLPDSVELPDAAETLAEIDEDPDKALDADVAVVLSSDEVAVLLSCEQALLGTIDTLNGQTVTGSLDGILERVERRTGFVGQGLPHQRLDVDGIPERSPMSMGFKSGFSDNQAPEDRVAIESGPFADGTLQHVSRLEIDLEQWWGDQDETDRVELMFSPEHTPEDVGDAGERLASQSQIDEADVERLAEDAERHAQVGHTQKVAQARDENFEPKILRRSEGISTGSPTPGFNFTSVQREIEHFVEVRKAMNSPDIDLAEDDHGILSFLEVHSRGNFLIPPRRLRALPPADPAPVEEADAGTETTEAA